MGGSGGSMGGSGGSVGGSGGSSGGVGGVGGNPACDGLFQFGDTVSVEHPPQFNDESPQFARSSDSGEQLTAVFTRQLANGTGARSLVHATLSPWQAWPSSVVSPAFTTFSSVELDPTFAVGGSFENHFAVLVAHASLVNSFVPRVDPHSQKAGPNLTVNSTGQPLFVSAGFGGQHFLASSDGKMMRGHIEAFNGSSFAPSIDFVLACGLGATVADAVPVEGGWIVALANEPTAPPVGCSAAANGASRLDVLRVDVGGAVSPISSLDAGAPIVQIAAASHSQGAWITLRVASGGIVAPIRWLRVDAKNFSVVGSGDVSDPGDFPLDGFDATAIGKRLAVVWGNDPANNPPDLTVSVIEESGQKVIQTAIEPGFFGPLSVAASPSGNSVVVGWHQTAAQGSGANVRLARFDCLVGP
jgi:hypothetical protein